VGLGATEPRVLRLGQSWDLGTATRAGLFPRSSSQLKLLTTFGGSGKIAG
jgi:hypothetical protein